jgi:23S rRNA pseudouridine2605 synthase
LSPPPRKPPQRPPLNNPPHSPANTPPQRQPPERLQKLLAAAGLGSRREIESWIEAGRVTIGGRVAKLGERASVADEIAVDGRRVALSPSAAPRVIAYHKPVGQLVTRSDPEGRPTVFASLPPLKGGRWVPVGRLDANSSGLLLFTDSGELANRLMHPRYGIEREYAVRVLGSLPREALEKLRDGVMLEDGRACFDRIEASDARASAGANRWYRVMLREGRKREVRRLFEAVGTTVSRLIRVRYGPVTLPRELRPGAWRELSPGTVKGLLEE